MDDLIAQLEAATEGDRELDEAIAHIAKTYQAPDRGDWTGSWPHYTTSLDAAMTLWPEGFIDLRRHSDGWYASVAEHSQSDRSWRGEQKPAALALCIAALKARNIHSNQT